MKRQFIAFVFLSILSSYACNLPIFKIEPVNIDGFDSLQDASNRKLTFAELIRVVRTVSRQNSVNENDAKALLRIYQDYTEDFYNGADVSNEDEFGRQEVEKYIVLMLQHEGLRDDVDRATFIESEKQMSPRIKFVGNNGVIASNIDVFINVLIKAYKEVFDADKDVEKLKSKISRFNDEKKVILLTAYESAAVAKVSGQIPATNEDKTKAAEFLKDLRDFNEQLDDKEKILDGNGRLINSQDATPSQRGNMKYTVTGGFDSSMKDQNKGRQLSEKLEHTMGYTALQMGIGSVKNFV